MNTWGRTFTTAAAVAGVGVVAAGALYLFNPAAAAPADVEPATVSYEQVDVAGFVDAARADKQAREAEAARIAAEVEAARVAAEALAAEQARVAAEQAAAEQAVAEESYDEPTNEEPAPEEPSGGIPAPWVDLGNGTGMWDFSSCPSQSGSTGADGVVYCN